MRTEEAGERRQEERRGEKRIYINECINRREKERMDERERSKYNEREKVRGKTRRVRERREKKWVKTDVQGDKRR